MELTLSYLCASLADIMLSPGAGELRHLAIHGSTTSTSRNHLSVSLLPPEIDHHVLIQRLTSVDRASLLCVVCVLITLTKLWLNFGNFPRPSFGECLLVTPLFVRENFSASGGSFASHSGCDKLFKKPFIFHFNQRKSTLIKKIHCKLLNLYGQLPIPNNQVKSLTSDR